MAFFLQRLQELDRADLARLIRLDTGARVLQHSERMQRNVGTGPGIGRGREVVGVGFAGDFEDRDREAFRHPGT